MWLDADADSGAAQLLLLNSEEVAECWVPTLLQRQGWPGGAAYSCLGLLKAFVC